MSTHYLLLICQKSCQPAILLDTVVGCTISNRRVCAHICNYLLQGQQNLGEAHKYPLHPLRKPRWPQGEIFPEWCFLRKQVPISVSWTVSFDISTDCFFLDLCNFHSQSPSTAYAWAPALQKQHQLTLGAVLLLFLNCCTTANLGSRKVLTVPALAET